MCVPIKRLCPFVGSNSGTQVLKNESRGGFLSLTASFAVRLAIITDSTGGQWGPPSPASKQKPPARGAVLREVERVLPGTSDEGIIIIYILQMSKLKHKVTWLAQGPTFGAWKNGGVNIFQFPEPTFFTDNCFSPTDWDDNFTYCFEIYFFI